MLFDGSRPPPTRDASEILFTLSLFSQSTSLPCMRTNATFLNLNLAQAERGEGGAAGGWGWAGEWEGWGHWDLVLCLPDGRFPPSAPSPPPQPWGSSAAVAVGTPGEKSSSRRPPPGWRTARSQGRCRTDHVRLFSCFHTRVRADRALLLR